MELFAGVFFLIAAGIFYVAAIIMLCRGRWPGSPYVYGMGAVCMVAACVLLRSPWPALGHVVYGVVWLRTAWARRPAVKLSPQAKYYISEQIRRPPDRRSVTPRRWWM